MAAGDIHTFCGNTVEKGPLSKSNRRCLLKIRRIAQKIVSGLTAGFSASY
jgi:hypothetical protein